MRLTDSLFIATGLLLYDKVLNNFLVYSSNVVKHSDATVSMRFAIIKIFKLFYNKSLVFSLYSNLFCSYQGKKGIKDFFLKKENYSW